MKCWKCGAEQPETKEKKLSFRAECETCHSWLHCCKNCKNYMPGKPNSCFVPGTEYIANREARNLCEDFELLGTGPKQGPDHSAFNSLFKD